MIDLKELDNFTGTEQYWKHWAGYLKLTDGTHYLEVNGAGWLVDAIASYQEQWTTNKTQVKEVPFQLWELIVKDNKGTLTLREDKDAPILVQQVIEWTDFPAPGIKLYAEGDVLLLPSEY